MKRIVITIVTLLVYLAVFISLMLPDLIKNYFPETLTEEGYLPEYLYGLYHIALEFSWVYILLVIFYMGYSALSKAAPKGKRYLWTWLILFGHFLTIPFFWYYYVWNEKKNQ